MELKQIFAGLSALIIAASYYPYLRDMAQQKTQPHSYTWLIWAITQGTAAAVIWYGEGGVGAWGITVGAILVSLTFLYSLKRGSKNITAFDTVLLVASLAAIVVWWQTNNALIALLMVSGIDLAGYIPTLRKSYSEPWSETMVSWYGFSGAYILVLLALETYNVYTLCYIIVVLAGNISVIAVCLARRRKITQPA